MKEDKIQPFSNGSEFMMWRDKNCDKCKKDYDNENEIVYCDIEEAIALASVSDGQVLKSIYKRAGLERGFNCPEKENI